ncbi:helix-turn-helix transcriptional regulator [Marinifilum fragile]|uniref:helix-turn-helix domain-containing protein n=1 Tax=Marinifilum fragile TaxID=570161 RepID=UPI002AA8A28E|nr:helix-turn-helix transcriptional regulator [Marinifilum fragile]
MKLADTIKQLREERGFLQKQVAAEIGLKPAHYNKLEKGMVEPSVDILDKLASLYGITIDQIVHPENNLPQEVTIEDKGLLEQVKLIQELEEKDRKTVFNIIDTMLTKAKFKDFFNKNIATL